MRLVRAEILKLRRRSGLMVAVGLLSFGAVAVYYAVLAGLRGETGHFDDAMAILAMTASVAGVLVGATAGGADIEAGVYRDLVATGRSRTALFAARVPGAWALVVPAVLAAIAIAAVVARPAAGDLVAGGAAALVSGMLLAAACVGLAALAGSRGMVIGVALAFQLGVSPLLGQLDAIGDARYAIPQVAIARIGGSLTGELALSVAVGVVLAWAAATLAAGLWRARTQEI